MTEPKPIQIATKAVLPHLRSQEFPDKYLLLVAASPQGRCNDIHRPRIIRMRQLSAAAFTLGALILAGSTTPAQATSIYAYKPDEYAVVDGGNAPNKQFSLATHGSAKRRSHR
jgi:hypothetical protein